METKNKEILKVKIGSKRIVVNYAEVSGEIVGNHQLEYSLKNKGIHPDLRKAMSVLDQYLADAFYLKGAKDRVAVDSVEYAGKEDEFVILGGQIVLASKNMASLKTDKIPLDHNDHPYGFKDDFKLDVGVFMNEVKLYCFENKQAQLDMFQEPAKEEAPKKVTSKKDKNQTEIPVEEGEVF